MIKKINFVAIKAYLLKHGEKVALGTCGGLVLILSVLGFWNAFRTSRSEQSKLWVEELRSAADNIQRQMDSTTPKPLGPEREAMLEETRYVWTQWTSGHTQAPFINVPEAPHGDKRENPQVLPIRASLDKKTKRLMADPVSMDYIRACALYYLNESGSRSKLVLDEGGAKVPAGAGQSAMPLLAKEARPFRGIAVSMVFPMKDQVETFRKSLRMATQDELFKNPADLPRVIGFNLVRYEIGANGKPVNPEGEWLVGYDNRTKRFRMAESIKRLLQEAVYDEKLAQYLEPYVYQGLIMPHPALGNAQYPKPDLSWHEGKDKDGKEKFGEIKIGMWYEDEDKRGDIVMGNPGQAKGQPKKDPGFKLPLGGKKDPRLPKDPGGADPGPNLVNLPEMKKEEITYKQLKLVDGFLAERLFSRDWEKQVNPYHVLGRMQPRDLFAKKDGFGAVQGQPNAQDPTRYFAAWNVKPGGADGNPGPGLPGPGLPGPGRPADGGAMPPDGGEVAAFEWDRDAIVRFIDPEVEPGKTYQYSIQIRMASPNHGKKELVAFARIADIEELEPSAWVFTPTYSIPKEFHLYAVDQMLLDEWADPKFDPKKSNIPPHKDQIAFQVHQWVKKKVDMANGLTHMIGDWAVAERIVVRRGDPIGAKAAVVVPVWKELKDAFEVPHLVEEINPKDKKPRMKPGIVIAALETTTKPNGDEIELAPPILVDYFGSERPNDRDKELNPLRSSAKETVAVEALILTSDGKLKVLNSRADSDPSYATGKERAERVEQSRRRARAFMSAGSDSSKKGPPLPGPAGGR